MLQVNSDWTKDGTSEYLESCIDFKFRGTGIYINFTDVMLVMPCGIPYDQMWKVYWPKTQEFVVYVWNRHIKDTILSKTIGIPTRKLEEE